MIEKEPAYLRRITSPERRIVPKQSENHPIGLDMRETIVQSLDKVVQETVMEFSKDPAFIHMLNDLIYAKNKDEIMNLIKARFLEGYKFGLEKSYDLLRKYDKQQVYEAIERFSDDEFIKKYFDS